MPEIKSIYVPYGELRSDFLFFGNDGLTRAENVVPVSGGYATLRTMGIRTSFIFPTLPLGFHAHPTAGNSWRGYTGTATALYEIDPSLAAWSVTDKTRLVGGAYAASDVNPNYGWQGASFGDSIVMTDYIDDPQLLTSPAAGNFVKLAQSGGGNPGMDPKAKFAFGVRGNMFLANLNLAAALLRPDGSTDLAAGAYPTSVCWSQTENLRQYGSFNATPQLTGTGYQPLNYDLGHITGGLGGDYALIAFQQGWARGDISAGGYIFRATVRGVGCNYPNSIVRFDEDCYFWGPTGPMVLRGGEGPAEPLARDRIMRALTDASLSLGYAPSTTARTQQTKIGAAPDQAGRHIWFSWTGSTGGRILIYNVDDGRFSFIFPVGNDDTGGSLLYPRSHPESLTEGWFPGRDIAGVFEFLAGGAFNSAVVDPTRGTGQTAALLARAFHQLEPEATTRVRRVRPIYSLVDPTEVTTVSVAVTSKNKPTDAGTPITYTDRDTHGWVTTPGTFFADFHQIIPTISCSDANLREHEGLEIEYEVGPRYSA
jgi:hypothetical protein